VLFVSAVVSMEIKEEAFLSEQSMYLLYFLKGKQNVVQLKDKRYETSVDFFFCTRRLFSGCVCRYMLREQPLRLFQQINYSFWGAK